jgi:hypothetical protein
LGARFPENLRVETNDYAGGISYDFSQDQAHPVEGWLILTENRRIASIDYCIQSKLQDEVCRVLKKKYGLRGTNNYGDDGYYVHFGTTNRQAVLRVTEWAHERDGHVYLEYRDEKLCQITESERRSRRIAAGEAPYLPEKPQESTTKSLTEQADDKVRAMREEFEARQRLADLSGQTSSEVKAAKKEEAWKEAALYEAAANRAQKVAWEAEKVAVEFEKEMRPVAEADKRKVDLATHEADVAAKVIADAQHETIFQLYSRRAATGDGYAQWRLGEMYLNGEGTETNLTLARKWLATAGTNWYAHATKELHTLQSSP